MATKKKKVVEDIANDIPVLATDAKAFAKKVKKVEVWPKVEKGTHLTVYTYEDGTTKLEWDDEALLNEVRLATKEFKPNVKAKGVSRKKKVEAKLEEIKPKKKTTKKSKA